MLTAQLRHGVAEPGHDYQKAEFNDKITPGGRSPEFALQVSSLCKEQVPPSTHVENGFDWKVLTGKEAVYTDPCHPTPGSEESLWGWDPQFLQAPAEPGQGRARSVGNKALLVEARLLSGSHAGGSLKGEADQWAVAVDTCMVHHHLLDCGIKILIPQSGQPRGQQPGQRSLGCCREHGGWDGLWPVLPWHLPRGGHPDGEVEDNMPVPECPFSHVSFLPLKGTVCFQAGATGPGWV